MITLVESIAAAILLILLVLLFIHLLNKSGTEWIFSKFKAAP